MKISELTVKQGNIEVEGKITEIGETRSFAKFGKPLTVANAMLTDDSGSIKLTLWNEEVTRFKEGDVVKIVNGYVNEFQGEKQLTAGKFGRIEKVSGSVGSITSNDENDFNSSMSAGGKSQDLKKSDPEDEFSEEDFTEESKDINEEDYL